MNTQQLFNVLKHDPYTSKFNCEVLPLNHFLENSITKSSLFIINYDGCDEPGSHWVAIFINTKKEIEFFDSFGMLPIYSSIVEKLDVFSNKKPTFNLFRFQGNSTVCGQYCLLYLLLKARGFTLKDIQSIFYKTETFVERDFVANHFINQRFGKLFASPLKIFDNFFKK